MFNRNLRTSSANLNRLNLGFGTRSFAAIANNVVGSLNPIRVSSIGDPRSPEQERERQQEHDLKSPHGETRTWLTDHGTKPDPTHPLPDRDPKPAADADADPDRPGSRHGRLAINPVFPVRMSMSLSTTTQTPTTPTSMGVGETSLSRDLKRDARLRPSPWFLTRTGPLADKSLSQRIGLRQERWPSLQPRQQQQTPRLQPDLLQPRPLASDPPIWPNAWNGDWFAQPTRRVSSIGSSRGDFHPYPYPCLTQTGMMSKPASICSPEIG